MKKLFAALVIGFALIASGCTRVETGHIGVRTSWDGTIKPGELEVGWHQTLIGSVTTYVANEITLSLSDLHPQTKDRTLLSDLDLTFTYSILPSSISELVTKYKGRNLVTPSGDIYPVGAYVQNVLTTASADVIANYNALEANENREQIRSEIRKRAEEILHEEELKGKVRIHQVFIKNLQIAKSIQDSSLAVINEQNKYTAKVLEVKTATAEGDRMKAIAANGDSKYVSLLNAQANMQIAEAIANGKVHTIVVPYDFKGIVNVK